MFGNFLKHYGKGKITQGVQALNDAIVSFDPAGATEAAISEMEENYDKINLEFSKTKQEYSREQAEADEMESLQSQRISAAENIASQLDDDPDSAQLNEALNQLVTAIEEMDEDVKREVQEAVDAKDIMDELGATVKMYGEKLKTARTDMKKAANAMKKAQHQKERAEVTAQRASQAAGLSSTVGGLSSALESMNRQASEAQAGADAAKRKAKLLTPVQVEDNDAVKAAMAAVSGETPAPTSARDRLAALRK